MPNLGPVSASHSSPWFLVGVGYEKSLHVQLCSAWPRPSSSGVTIRIMEPLDG